MQRSRTILAAILPLLFAGCMPSGAPSHAESFGENLRKLSSNVHTIVLTDNFGKSRLAVVPRFQGRVMTSTASGADGVSTGKIHHEVIVGAATMPKFSSVGGEERFTLAPEGGQFGLFFPSGAEFTRENFSIPDALEKEPFDIMERAADKITLSRRLTLTNYSNKIFQLKITRTVRVLPVLTAWKELGAGENKAVAMVAYETENSLANFSKTPWRKEEGLPSISTVHTVAANESASGLSPVVIIPIRAGDAKILGPEVDADYPAENPFSGLSVSPTSVVLASAPRTFKLAVSPKRTVGLIAVYNPTSQMLTIVQFMPFSPGAPYVEGMWGFSKTPYAGSAATAKAVDGGIELQTFSPALELGGWNSATHTARTFHLFGKAQDLDPIAKSILGVSILQFAPK